jgi:hypothetical protein
MADPKPDRTGKPDQTDTDRTRPKDNRSGLGSKYLHFSVSGRVGPKPAKTDYQKSIMYTCQLLVDFKKIKNKRCISHIVCSEIQLKWDSPLILLLFWAHRNIKNIYIYVFLCKVAAKYMFGPTCLTCLIKKKKKK